MQICGGVLTLEHILHQRTQWHLVLLCMCCTCQKIRPRVATTFHVLIQDLYPIPRADKILRFPGGKDKFFPARNRLTAEKLYY